MYVLLQAVVTGCENSAAPLVGLHALGYGVPLYWGFPSSHGGCRYRGAGTKLGDLLGGRSSPWVVTACVPSYFITQLKSVLY